MTASVRYWKRFTPETSAPVTLTTSCSILPSRVEPIQLRLTASQDGKMAGKHFVITMTASEARELVAHVNRHIARLEPEVDPNV